MEPIVRLPQRALHVVGMAEHVSHVRQCLVAVLRCHIENAGRDACNLRRRRVAG
jgi:hypothetical protein